MTDRREQVRAAFRLNLEQQKNRAKDLLKAARSADAASLARFALEGTSVQKTLPGSQLRLADAQFVIARELGLTSWSDLKSHIASMDDARTAIKNARRAPDSDVKTLHLRCGSDIRSTLREAGFSGEFLEHSFPYCHGPVTATPDHLEREARFIVESAGRQMNISFAGALARRQDEERELAASAQNYQRVVLWMEHDCFDQLVLVRCLAHYASTRMPRILELININHFPGSIRFIGLGQLPVEAIRLLWERRRPVTPEQLRLATQTWNALTSEDPRTLAAIMRTGTASLSHLAIALGRQLRELPSLEDGMSLTERLILQSLAGGTVTLKRLFAGLTYERDPLPFATDLMLLHTIERMHKLSPPVLARSAAANQWDDALTITETGLAVLRGECDWLSLQPSARWVGGVQVRPGVPVWRWDERQRDAVLR